MQLRRWRRPTPPGAVACAPSCKRCIYVPFITVCDLRTVFEPRSISMTKTIRGIYILYAHTSVAENDYRCVDYDDDVFVTHALRIYYKGVKVTRLRHYFDLYIRTCVHVRVGRGERGLLCFRSRNNRFVTFDVVA